MLQHVSKGKADIYFNGFDSFDDSFRFEGFSVFLEYVGVHVRLVLQCSGPDPRVSGTLDMSIDNMFLSTQRCDTNVSFDPLEELTRHPY